MNVVLATGGSGGHMFPALKLAETLKNQGHDIVFAGTLSKQKSLILNRGFPIKEINSSGFVSQGTGKVILSFFRMMKACWQSFRFHRANRPDVVVGFGGYGAFPIVFTAAILRIPTLIHEQNVIPGKANSILARFVDAMAVSFKETINYFRSEKITVTGCPSHLTRGIFDKKEIYQRLHLQENLPTILIFGGSQGSHRINEEAVKAIELLIDEMPVQVIHITGEKDHEQIRARYRELNIPATVFPFLEDMQDAYHITDLVISRSGALTITEITLFQLPAILIPYPYAASHQLANAQVLSKSELVEIIEEKDLTRERLRDTIVSIYARSFRCENSSRLKEIVSIHDADQRLAKAVVDLVK